MALANTLSYVLPPPLRRTLRPRWRQFQVWVDFFRQGGRLRRERAIGAWLATREMGNGRRLGICVRSYKELRRFHIMGRGEFNDAVWKWLHWIRDGGMLYDVGSANGLEGALAYHLHDLDVVFIEPYTPSIESILKTMSLAIRDPQHKGRVEIVHAGCDAEESYSRLLMHHAPVAGETRNTFRDAAVYCDAETRVTAPVAMSQWVKGVTLDSLHEVYGLDRASYVKIDVDGYEGRVLRGAEKLLEAGTVKSWAIETSGADLMAEVAALMTRHGYVEAARHEHYPGDPRLTYDFIYVRPELLDDWQKFGGFPH